jgi:hypothetical protein
MQALFGDRKYKVVVTVSAMAHIAVPGYALYSSLSKKKGRPKKSSLLFTHDIRCALKITEAIG